MAINTLFLHFTQYSPVLERFFPYSQGRLAGLVSGKRKPALVLCHSTACSRIFLPAEIINTFNLIGSLLLEEFPTAVDSFVPLFCARFRKENELLWLTPEGIILILKHVDETSVPRSNTKGFLWFQVICRHMATLAVGKKTQLNVL